MDKSNGYEANAAAFVLARNKAIGVTSVRNWLSTLPPGADVLDLGCGTGIPITRVLVEERMNVFGLDASPSLIKAFRENFPHVPAACEAAEDSAFFNQKFEAIIAWGLLFLMKEETQVRVIEKVSAALKPGGKFLFTAPSEKAEWDDLLTGERSRSLGEEQYKDALANSGFSNIEAFTDDEGNNHYYTAIKK